jgi:predicted ferric reductase
MIEQAVPWAWYFARAAGLVSFLLLYISIFLGLTVRIPFLRKLISPAYSPNLHRILSLYALLFALLHGVVLIFDNAINFTLVDVFVPFAASYHPQSVALGILAFYLMLILVITSYGKRFISHKVWRVTHFMNIVLYVIGIIHAVTLGTDMKNPVVFGIFLWANALLVFIMLYNLELRLALALKRKAENNQTS